MAQIPLRIGVVGAGGICRNAHFPGFKKLEDCQLVAVCNRTPESTAHVAREFGIPHVESSWKRLVARKDLNVVLIGTWPYLHRDVTLAALQAGKHVLCESRMAWDASQAHAMQSAARRAKEKHGLVTMLCPPPTGFRGDYVMKELLAGGYLGKPYQLYVRHMSGGLLDPAKPLIWRQLKKFQGLNALTLGMLNEPVERWFGATTRVLAAERIFTPRRPLRSGGAEMGRVERPDCIHVLAQMKNGMEAVYMFSGMAMQSGWNVVEAFGSAGMIRYDLDTNRIFASHSPSQAPDEVPIPEAKARTWRVEAEFAAAIREGRKVSPNFDDGVKYMEFTEAVARSARTGKAVNLPL